MLSRIGHAALAAALVAGGPLSAAAQTQGAIKIGVLHSLSGTMAISETTFKDTILMMVDDVNGDANVPFYKELANAGIKASDIPVVAFSVGEEELAGIDTKNLVGHLAAWNYFHRSRIRQMRPSSSSGTTSSRTRSG